MPNDLSIQAVPLVNIGNGGVASVKPTATAASVEQTAPVPSPSPNPTLELNAALGLVVIEFRNDAGAITSSIPTQQQLEAYRLWQESGIGPAPSLGPVALNTAAAPAPATSGGNSRAARSEVGD
jgi:hypothetical protein